MMMATSPVLRAALLAAFMVALHGCGGPAGDDRYTFVTAEIGDVRDSVPATGTLMAVGGAEIRAPRQGVIAAVHVKEGDTVRAGQVLATLAAPMRAPSQDEAEASAAASDAALRETQVALKTAEERLQRSRTLQDQGFVSAANVRTAEADVEQAQATIERLTSERAAARARLRLASAQGSESDIVAPLDGTVTLATARVGQRVSPEDERALFQTGQGIKELTLEILISEADLSRVSMNSQVLFSVDAYPGITEQATLVSIGEAPIREGRFVSYRAVATFNNFTEVMKPGMSASVQLVRADARSVLRVPVEATYFEPPDYMPPLPPGKLEELKQRHKGQQNLIEGSASGLDIRRMLIEGWRPVFVLENGQPVRKEVFIGAQTDEYIEVIEGLKPGDRIILKSNTDPRDAV